MFPRSGPHTSDCTRPRRCQVAGHEAHLAEEIAGTEMCDDLTVTSNFDDPLEQDQKIILSSSLHGDLPIIEEQRSPSDQRQ